MILILDNYDSFVFNLARSFCELGQTVRVARPDGLDLAGIRHMQPDAIVLSPGPCAPAQADLSLAVVRHLAGQVPILGVCLGHQCIGAAFGGRIERAQRPLHGQASAVFHEGAGLFDGLPNGFMAGRYHSLIVADLPASAPLRVTARSAEGEIMALAHTAWPVMGVQFHPESILTDYGHAVLENFLRLSRGATGTSRHIQAA
jgi:para-aminobenzoate synthetase component II